MAVYQAVQHVTVIPRRRTVVHQRARRGASRVGLVLGAILVAFLLALFYLTQAVGAATAGYDFDRMTDTAIDLQRQLSTQQGDIAAVGSEQRVLDAAQTAGLVNLTLKQPMRVPGR